MYSSLLLCLRRYARCFDFHVSLNVVVDNSFWHVFERDAVVRPLCPLANPLCGCFCLGSCPFCVSGLLFFFDETQIWLGDLRVVWLVCVILVCCDLPAFSDLLGLCTNDVFTAYAHVRTEPQCDIGHTRGKSRKGAEVVQLEENIRLRLRPIHHGFQLVGGSGGSSGVSGTGGHQDSSAKVASASVSASVVSRSSSEEGSSTVSPAPSGPVMLLARRLS